jgi:CheY-like chemotaxis protein
VNTGEEAIPKAEELSPDLVLMDIKLKGKMNGIEAAKEIRSKIDIPVVFLTAYADEYTFRQAQSTDPFGYIVKPFNERELRIVIEIALYKFQAEQEKNRLIEKLQKALAEIKTLRGIIPICASCGKVRNDEGYWQKVEEYVRDHTEAQFSHGVCPNCARKLYGDIFEEEDEK